MAYTPTVWQSGDIVSSANLNKLENAVKGISEKQEVKILTPTGDTHTLDPCPVTYSFGVKTTLSVTVTDDDEYHFMFQCPSNAPTNLTITGITATAGDALAANNIYEVDVWAGIALVRAIEVSA